jgi:3-oxoacyl-[acyl-carrier-protein] synthase II
MSGRRVVITGLGVVSPFGRGIEAMMQALEEGRSAVVAVPELAAIGGLRSRVAALVTGIDPMDIPRRWRRSMSPMSIYATLAAQDALAQAGIGPEECASGRLGVSVGSTVGSTQASQDLFAEFFKDHSLERVRSTVFFQIMSHSCAVNVAQAHGITGRLLAPAAACSTGCQAVGFAFEMIAAGKQDVMLCGGADEFHAMMTATFDIINAATTGYNDRPMQTPRPFDRDRDGIVCSEGSGILVLEALDSAERRGARILAEMAGFATVADPTNIANPNADAMESCMRAALDDAGLRPEQVGYVNAHATATIQGDVAECEAIQRIFGASVPVSSLKGHIGHTMGASGSLEMAAAIEMMNQGRIIPTLNLDNVDPACAQVRHVHIVEDMKFDAFIKNNFALGGVNSSIVVKRYSS